MLLTPVERAALHLLSVEAVLLAEMAEPLVFAWIKRGLVGEYPGVKGVAVSAKLMSVDDVAIGLGKKLESADRGVCTKSTSPRESVAVSVSPPLLLSIWPAGFANFAGLRRP